MAASGMLHVVPEEQKYYIPHHFTAYCFYNTASGQSCQTKSPKNYSVSQMLHFLSNEIKTSLTMMSQCLAH